jgi:WS/DGAT/MGAT family acyltransferase
MDHLSGIDASFLHLETPETPMHVGGLMLFELPEGYEGDYYEDVKALIARRMHLCDAFNRKLAQMPFELADPVWIQDDDIDIDYHVRSLTLRRPGTMAQLEALVARLHSSLLDRSRPLWEVYVIDGLEDGRIAFYTKAHHAGVDGKAGVEMAKVFYDTTPEERKVAPPRRARARNAYQLGVAEMVQAALSNSVKQYVKAGRLIPSAVKALGMAGKIVATRRTAKDERSLNIGIAPKSPFNVPITNQRSFSVLSLPLEEVKALGKRVGGTVNTVVMAMCSTAVRRFLRDRDLLPEKGLVAAVPVSLRAADDDSMNNQVSMVRVDLATDIADPVARFKAIHASSEGAKAVVSKLRPVLGVDVPITGAPWLVSGLASLYGRSGLASRMPAAANVTISNVPGIPVTLYMAGARMTHYYPVSIPYHGMALNITVQSYAGQLEFGLTACRRAVSQSESHELIANLLAALDEIRGFERVAGSVPAEAAGTKGAPAAGRSGKAAASKETAAARKKTAAASKKTAAASKKPAAAAKKSAAAPQETAAAAKKTATAAKKTATPSKQAAAARRKTAARTKAAPGPANDSAYAADKATEAADDSVGMTGKSAEVVAPIEAAPAAVPAKAMQD